MLCHFFSSRRVVIEILALVAFITPAGAAFAEKIPAELFFKPDAYQNVEISPDGKFIAAVARLPDAPDARNILVIDLESNKPQVLTGYETEDVGMLHWISNERLIFNVYDDFDATGRRGGYVGTFAINRDGKKGSELHSPYARDRRGMRGAGSSSIGSSGGIFAPLLFVDPWFDNPDYVVVQNIDSRILFPDVSRLDVKSGQLRKMALNDIDMVAWFTDHNGQPRAGLSSGKDRDDVVFDLMYQPADSKEWISVVDGTMGKFGLFGFDQDNEHLFVGSTAGTDRMALYRVDPMNPSFEKPLASDDTYDVAGDVYYSRNGKPLFVDYQGEKPKKLFFDQTWADRQASIDAALADTVNDFVSWDDDETRFLIHAWSDRHIGDYYLYDEAQGKLRFLMSTASWLDPDQMASMMPIEFEARDGVQIHGYLTLPVDAGDGPYPMIVHPHGGPYGIRDEWGYNREVQFLANRGYAVLQVNYRGSGGYGLGFEYSGHKKWGLEMQDDLTDAVEWTIDQGYVNKDRVCIYGASYGGYATLMGLVKTPELYRCGINYVGVSDLNQRYQDLKEENNVTGQSALSLNWFAWAMGDIDADKDRFYETSPINHVDKIQAPLLVVHGVDDTRVPVIHSRRLVRKLESEDKIHEYHEKSYEGHGFFTPANQIDLYNTIEEFLAKYNN